MALMWDDRQTSTDSSVGEVVANCEAMLVEAESESGTEITKSYERGELWVRGPNVMKGYWRNPQATKATITSDGWLKTGDIAYVDDEKKFFIVDRKKVRSGHLICRMHRLSMTESPGVQC
jgi:4-coumarate--CoA ligase